MIEGLIALCAVRGVRRPATHHRRNDARQFFLDTRLADVRRSGGVLFNPFHSRLLDITPLTIN